MLHRLLFEPYASPAAEARAEALQNSLADLNEGVLLLNLLLDAELLDAVLLLPQGVAVLRLLPGGQELSASALAHGPWLLDGQLLPDFAGTDNPYQQVQRQRPALAAWLAEQPLLPTIAPETIKAMAVFAGVGHFGAGLEAQLRKLHTDEQLQLVRQPGLVLRSFQHMPVEKAQGLPAATLDAWAAELLQTEDVPAENTQEPEANDDLLTRKARQLWRWLGAEDVPADPPYGTTAPAPAPDPVAASQQEKRRLEQIRQQIRVEVSEQTQALQTREAARDQTIAQLRQQLADSAAAAPETTRLQARLATEAREKAALEEAIRVARTESETRNRDLDARIQQLGQQLQQLQERPVPAIAPPVAAVSMEAPTTATPATTAPAAIRTVAPTGRVAASRPKTPRPPAAPTVWRLQWPRVLLAGLLLSVVGTAVWGITQLPGWLRNPENAQPAAISTPRASGNEEAAAPTLSDIQPDTIQLTPTEIEADSAAAAEEQAILAADSLVMPAPANEVMDSVVAPPDDM